MLERQSWKSCRYHLGDLEINLDSIAKTRYEIKLIRAIFPETKCDELFRKEGINQRYYCTNSKLIELNVYRRDGIPKKKEGFIRVAQLFHLDISDDPSLDWFGNDRRYLKIAIEDGLRMCTHCRFYEEK